ncbi:MAG: hypothetical protein GVY18_13280 [Bacteroidetes bacterium]|nr:hypothetical protein [Bacteroidota bacterium]
MESFTGEAHNFERLGEFTASERTTRHQDTPVNDAPHSRRLVTPGDYDWGDLVDREDKLRLLIEPESNYMRAARNALGRKLDDVIIAAMGGNAQSKAADGTLTNVALPAGQKVGVQFGTAGTDAGLTLDKILEGIRILQNNEAWEDGEMCIAYGSKQVNDVLKIAELTSSDYQTMQALTAGTLEGAGPLGLRWIRTERLPLATADRSVYMWNTMAVGTGVNEEFFGRIAPDPTKGFAHRVYARGSWGATRIWDEGVVEIIADEAP